MPTHLYTLPRGTALPSPTNLPEGYPFVLDDGTVHVIAGGAFVAVGGGGGALPVYTTTAVTYNIAEAAVVIADSSTNAITIVPEHEAGRMLIVKKPVLENTVTIDPPFGFIDASSTYVLTDANSYVQLVSDGAKWYRIG